ncbi:MAG: hypothetical protein VX733_13885 [Candidatus Latescibacterota bacterium]|nr:hypothetical protein [Candidatus Latescibacterota bacterium]
MRGSLPFTRRNWILFAAGIAVIAVGYLMLRIPPADGFLSLTAAPILLVLGYCVLLPMAILARGNVDDDSASPAAQTASRSTETK